MFRELEELVTEVRTATTALGLDEDLALEEKRLQLLMQLVSYVNSYEWLSHEKIREKVKCFLKSRYDYRLVAEQFGLPISNVHKCISYASDRLRKRIGGVLTLICSNHLVDAERELAMVTGGVDPSALFVRGILERIDCKKDAGIDLATCKREISFLSYFTNRNIDTLVESIDTKKLGHLLYVLVNSDSTYPERGILARCIFDGELNASEAIEQIKAEFIYSDLSE